MNQPEGPGNGDSTVSPDFKLADYYKDNRWALSLDWIICGLLILLILLAPLPFGSVSHLPVLFIEILALSCFLIWIIRLTCCANKQQLSEFRIRSCLSGFFSIFGYPVRKTGMEWIAIGFLSLLVFQLIPLPAQVTQYLSPSAHAIYASASEAASVKLAFHALSLNPFATFSKMLLFSAYFLIYLTAANNLHKPVMARALIYAICLSIAFQSVYGLYELLSGRHHIFHFAKVYNRTVATGTFINRNHYALCLEMGIPFLIALAAGVVSGEGRKISGKAALGLKSAVLACLIVSSLAGILLSFSRSGILFAGASLSLFFSVYWIKKEVFSRRLPILGFVFVAVIAAVMLFMQPLSRSFIRLPEEWTAEGSRVQVWRDTFTIFTHFPLAGIGIGTFEQAYPMFQSSTDQTVFDHAHNDFLEFLAESGGVFLILWLSSVALLMRRFRQILTHSVDSSFLMRLAASGSLLSLLLHSLVDFPLQIPALAVLGSIVSAIFLNQEFRWKADA